jgi:hypothetical protein
MNGFSSRVCQPLFFNNASIISIIAFAQLFCIICWLCAVRNLFLARQYEQQEAARAGESGGKGRARDAPCWFQDEGALQTLSHNDGFKYPLNPELGGWDLCHLTPAFTR